MPLYGRTYTLADPGQTYVGAPTVGDGGNAGPFTETAGFLGYNELCGFISSGQYQRAWDWDGHVPYAFRGNQWITYDDVESITHKSEFILNYGLGGAMVWSIDTEDFHGPCGQGPNPLLQTINRIVRQ